MIAGGEAIILTEAEATALLAAIDHQKAWTLERVRGLQALGALDIVSALRTELRNRRDDDD